VPGNEPLGARLAIFAISAQLAPATLRGEEMAKMASLAPDLHYNKWCGTLRR
jgi:hypothetical protein